MTGEEIHKKYLELSSQVAGDEELTIKTLLKLFGDADTLWHLVHVHITGLDDAHRVDTTADIIHPLEEEIQKLEQAFNEVMSEIIESEFLMDRIDTITKTAEGFRLHTSAGKEIDITDREVKEKIVLINREPAFDHFAGLMEESDVMEVFKIVDLFYVE